MLEEEDSEKNWEQEGHGEVLYHGSQKGPTGINRTEQVQLGFNTVGLGYENLLYRVLVKRYLCTSNDLTSNYIWTFQHLC